jgi:hypothetical protein
MSREDLEAICKITDRWEVNMQHMSESERWGAWKAMRQEILNFKSNE